MFTRFFAAATFFCVFLTGNLLAQSSASDIIVNGAFVYPQNIPYELRQEAGDIAANAASVLVASFTLRDGGGASDGDALTTEMSSITFDLGPNWQMIRLIELRTAADGAVTVSSILVSAQTVQFSGMTAPNSIVAPDNGSINFGVRVSFMDTPATITDNTRVTLTVSNVTATGGGSTFAAADGGAATTSVAGDDNRIEVTATKLLFVQGPSNVQANVAMAPAVTIESVDGFNVRDLDNTSAVAVTSTGTLTGTPVTINAVSGLATFSTLTHTAVATGRTLSATATTPALTGVGPSSTFSVGGSDIILTPAYDPTDNIPYASHQEAANIQNNGNSIVVASFRIRDGGPNAPDADGTNTLLTGLTLDLGPNFAMFRRIELRTAADAAITTSGTNEQVVAGQSVVFTGLNGAGVTCADNGTLDFLVRVSFLNTAPQIIDNTQFQFTITSTTNTGTPIVPANGGGATTPITGNDNRIEVTATKLLFVQGPSNVVANASMSPSVTIESVDGNNLRDLDNTSNVLVTSTGTLTGTPVTVAAVNGLATFSSLTHTVAQAGRTLSATSNTPVLTGVGPSATFNVTGTSDIIPFAGFVYPSNIAYDGFQETNITVASPVVAKFDLRDGSGAADGDVTPTVLTDITFSLTNFANIRRMAIYDAAGTTELAEVAVSSGTVTFNGLTISAADGASTAFTVLASFNDPVTDNQQFQLTVTSATSQPGNSAFVAANAGGATSSVAGNDNRIEVTATKLAFVVQPSNAFIAVNMSPAVTIEAVDGLDNRDLDNVSSVAVTSTGTLTGTPVTIAAVAGLATFSTLQHSAVGTGLTLSATSTGPVLTAVGPSNTFTIVNGSDIIREPTFDPTDNIAYANFQAVDITNTTTGVMIGRFTIRDGGGITDPGAAATTMTNLSIDLGPNFAMFRRVALFNTTGATQMGGTSEVTVGTQIVNFSALTGTGTVAPDGSTVNFSVLATFVATAPAITDNTQFQITLTAGTATGSVFGTPFATSTSPIVGDDNRIEVSATKLLFAQGPSNVEANASMTPAVTIESVDANNIRDLDNTSNVLVTSTGTLTGTPVTVAAVNGLATFSTLTHTLAQTGRTLSATSNTPVLLPVGPSVTFNVTGTSDIIAFAGFVYPSNIAYDGFQETNITVASPVVSKFDLRDGSGAADGDVLPTVLTDITFSLTNFANIRRMAIYDAAGTTELAEVAVSSGTVTFNGLSISAADGASTAFTVLASFNDPVTDNQQFQLTVTSATAQPGNSAFTAPNAGGAASSVASDDNRIEVTATKLLFVQQPSNVFLASSMTPAVTIEAVDNLDNRDLDNASNIAVTSTGTLSGTPVTTAAASGLATFASLTHTLAGTGLTLSATAAAPALTATGPSSTFYVSGGSDIINDGTFVYIQNIDYATAANQNTSITNANGTNIAKFMIRDGGGVVDPGGSGTQLTDITIDFGPNFAMLREAELWISDMSNPLTGGGEKSVSTQTVSWTGLSGASTLAADGGTISFFVRVSFQQLVTDNVQISATISAATATGSTFAAADAGAATTSLASDDNRIEVIATKALFVQGASDVFVNAAMTPAPTVESVNTFNIRDLDNASSVAMTSNGALSGSPVTVLAVNGLATFPAIIHTATASNKNITATPSSPGLTAAVSANFNIVLAGSDIITNAAFVYPINIAYDTFQEGGNIVNSGTSLVAAKFDLRDGSGTSDGDALATTLTNITLDLGPNFGLIRRIALFDAAGTTQLSGVGSEFNVTTQTVAFSGLSLAAADNANVSFTVRVSFQNTGVTDNLQFSFTVTAATATGSIFSSANAGGATTSLTGDNNRIEVLATNVQFVQDPSNTFINVAMAPSVTVQAADNLDNRDLDNASTISITSSGTLVGSPVTVLAVNGLSTFPTLTHSAAGTALTLSGTSSGPVLTPTGNSIPFDIFGPSNASDIIANAGFVYPQNIAYEISQEPTDVVNSATSVVAAKFDVRDGGGAADGDPFPTVLTGVTLDLGPNFSLIRRISLFDAAGTTELPFGGINDQPVVTQLVSFSGLSVSAADNGSTSFTVRVSFQSTVTDNLQFSFAINSTTTQATNSSFATANAGGAVSSTVADNNRIEVAATKLRFIQNPTSTFINTNMSPAVTVEAVDPLNNRDLDNVSSIDITSTGSLIGSPANANAAAGLATFPTLQHSAAGVGLTLSATAGGLTTTGPSTTFGISDGSDIAVDPAYVFNTNIPYNIFQEPVNITSLPTSIVAARFLLRDGGAAPVDPDITTTQLTNLSLDLGPNFTLIRRIALYNAAGNVELPAALLNEQNVVGQVVNFAGLTLTAPDNGQTAFTVRVSFNAGVVDNLQFSFTVTSASAFVLGSQFAQPNAGGAITSTAGDNNRIEVLATLLAFVQQPSNTFINVGMTPSVTVETVDNLNSRDLDYAANVSITSNGTLTGTPVTIAAINGLTTFPGLAHSVAQVNRTLTATSGGLTLALSTTFNILPPSNQSDIVANGAFLYQTNIPYNNFQENINITNTGTSLVVAEFDVRDGGGAADADPFPTVLTNITLDLGPNFNLIRRIALYDAAGTAELAGVNEQAVASQLIAFSGLSVSAPDGGSTSFTVRVSFQDPVTDNLQFSFTVNTTATLAINSSFALPSAGGNSSSVAGNNNRIEVTATKLLFVQGPTNTFINVSMAPSVTVEAVDPLDNRDLDYVTNVSITSTGTLTGSPVVVAPISGLATFSTLAHSVAQAARTIAATSGALTATGPSTTFNILAPSALSNIVLDGTFLHPSNIAYNTFQENLNIINSTSSLVVGRFIVQDGGGAADADAFPTAMTSLTLDLGVNFGLINRIALYDASGTIELAGVNEQVVGAQTVVFSGLSITAPDNGATTFTVRVSFKSAVTDNLQFSVLVSNTATVAINSSFAAANAGGAVTSTAVNDNRIEVTATLLRFTTNFTSPLLAAKDIAPVQQPAPPVIRAEDVLVNVDLDYVSMGTITCALSVTPSINITAVAGVFNFPSTFQYLQTGNGTITFNAPSLIGVVSNAVTVNAGTATTITAGSAAPPTISSLINTVGAALPVFSFVVNDDPGGTPANNDDGLPTLITQIVITQNSANNDIILGDWTQAIGGATLSDGVNPAIAATAITATSISFGGISTAPGQVGNIPDNTPKTYTLRIFLKAALGGTLPTTIDGKKFEFQVLRADVTLATTGSTTINPGESETSGNANAVAVVATALRFTSPTSPPNPDPMNVSLDTDFPGVKVEATDANFNRDLNFVTAISALTNASSVTMSPVIVGNSFAAGEYLFPSNFRFTSGTSGNPVRLTITAGFTTQSIGLTLLSSSESSIVNDPTFTYPNQLQYIQHQAADIDITTVPLSLTSVEIARMLLVDGNRNNAIYGASTVQTSTAVDLTVNGDDDGADTRLTKLTLRVTNPSALRRIAIYNGSIELGEIDVQSVLIPGPFQDFTFNGAPTLLVAPDNNIVPTSGIVPISVRVSFMNTAALVSDGNLINVSVSPVASGTLTGTGSNFFAANGAIPLPVGLYQSPTPGFNRLNVTATSLDFVQQPGAIAGVNEPVIPAAIVHARDANAIVDTDFGFPASVTTPVGEANVLGTFGFSLGVLNMGGLITYSSAGIGTLTVKTVAPAPVLNSATGAVPCNRVDVIQVTTNRQDGGVINPNGSDQVSVLAGTSNVTFFGFGFNSTHNFGGNPKVTKFTMNFNTSVSGILSNIEVYESTNNQRSSAVLVNAVNVTATSTSVTVDFTGSPKDLSLLPNLTYFLEADVSAFVGGSTANLQVSIVDGGVASGTQNNVQVLGNVGSQLANTFGTTWVFASVAPPTLVSTYPRIGQTNVDPAQAAIEMSFSVPVFSYKLLGAELYKKVPGFADVKVADLKATNGFPFDPSGIGAARPIVFSMVHPSTGLPVALVADTEYYVLVPAGNLSTLVGILDQSQNLFPGISYSGAFFFRTGNSLGPNLLSTSTTDITNAGATINATFDKLGKAYYIVSSTNNGSTAPTYAEIVGGTWAGNTVVASGQFPINTTITVSAFGTFAVPGGFIAGTHHVWITAESNTEKKVGATITTTPHPVAPPPYGSSTFSYAVVGSLPGPATGPTFNFPAPGSSPTPNVTTNNVSVALCSNSFQVLNSPIIIYEGTNPGQTFQNPAPDQTFYLVLPSGFQFDDTVDPITLKPLYATVTLVGGDFLPNSQTVRFLSTSVLKITFTNQASSTLDQLVISNLRVKSDGARAGDIVRLGGSGIPAINDNALLARLSAQEAAIVDFDNSYSLSLGKSWGTTGDSETAIPDNAIPALVTLAPSIPNPFDFGPTSFSGQGVNINELNVNGVTKDVPFNITVVHTDQNGCISDNPVQFVVYDNKRAVIVTNDKYDPAALPVGTPVNPANLPIDLDQGPYAASIPAFQINQQIASAGPSIVRDVTFDNLGAYYMEYLVAEIPPGTSTFFTTPALAGPIINGSDYSGAWKNIVKALPMVQDSVGNPVTDGHVINGRNFFDYKFDDQQIVNAHAIPAGAAIPYIYDYPDPLGSITTPFYFKRNIPAAANPNYPGGITYYTGGSLGFVQLTGSFRNIANPVVKITRRQLVQFYLPAVPAIEFTTPASFLINGVNGAGGNPPAISDGLNPPSNSPLATPVNPNNFNNPGTLVFCENGGDISVAAWPKPDVASGSTGTFKLFDAQTGTPIVTGLIDPGTGTATIKPLLANVAFGGHVAYADIRVEYTFNDGNDSENNLTPYTASTKANQIFRIAPNPTATFGLTTNLPNPYVSGTGAYCVAQPITFNPSGSTPGAGGGSAIFAYSWNFDDPSNSLPGNPNSNTVSGPAGQPAIPGPPPIATGIAGTNDLPIHTFSTAKTYNPTLTVVSNFGCPSPVATLATIVGGIPVVKAIIDGTHAGPSAYDAFHFKDNNSTVSNSTLSTMEWTFGDRPIPTTPEPAITFTTSPVAHNYTATGQMVYDLKLTSSIGCVNSLSLTNIAAGYVADDATMRTLIVLPRFTVTAVNAYQENFEPPIPADVNAPLRIWQPWFTGAFQPTTPAATPPRSVDPTWTKGAPTGQAPLAPPPGPKFSPTVNGSNIWATGLTGTYSALERSALYSPSMNLASLLRPMISLDTYTDMKGGDGVVVQFSTDNKNITDPTKTWWTLGNITDGENWYTDQGISAKPGDQAAKDYGWSTKSQSWLSSRHALSADTIGNSVPLLINAPRVIFRLAMASASSSAILVENGFGFDNVRVGERTRTILLETFTNTSNETMSAFDPTMKAEKYENTVIQGFNSGSVGLEVVKLNYHVNFPANDPFNATNPADPSSRALFYSVSQTPASRLDGYAPAPYAQFSQWGGTNFSTRTLRLAQADILIRPVGGGPAGNITSSGKISFEVVITPTVTLDDKTILHVGIVEQSVPLGSLADPTVVKTGETTFEYVVKKLLPTASGTRTGVMTAAPPAIPPVPPNTYTFGPYEWDPILSNFHAPSTGDLGVIAFLQRENGDREVYQAEIVLSLDDPPSNLVTGVEPISADQVLVYPVPANHEMTIQMPGPLAKAARLSMIDQTGRETLTSSIPEGADRKTLNVGDLSGGVYILTIDMGQGVLARKKVMIVHQD